VFAFYVCFSPAYLLCIFTEGKAQKQLQTQHDDDDMNFHAHLIRCCWMNKQKSYTNSKAQHMKRGKSYFAVVAINRKLKSTICDELK
jgi:hypothetical protein